MFLDEEISTTDCVDALSEGQIYDNQDMAAEIVADGWSELRRRQSSIGSGSPFSITALRLKRIKKWDEVPAHSFCLILALQKWFRKWAKQFGKSFNVQGELFELVTKESLEHQFSGWTIHKTGWSTSAPNKLGAVVDGVVSHLGEPRGKVERWTKPDANEAGLDLLCYRPFADKRVGIPVYLMQCASGGDWEGKLHTPSLKIWGRVVEFTAKPRKAFATPFAFLNADFIRNCNLVDGLLLDRYRLLAPARENNEWISGALRKKLVAWVKLRIRDLPLRE